MMTEAQVRAALISLLEGYAGTLRSVPWSQISLVDLHALVTMVHINVEDYTDLLQQASEIIVANDYSV